VGVDKGVVEGDKGGFGKEVFGPVYDKGGFG
jgi:hypothetical protein